MEKFVTVLSLLAVPKSTHSVFDLFDVPLHFIKGLVKGLGKYTWASSQKWFKDIVKYA